MSSRMFRWRAPFAATTALALLSTTPAVSQPAEGEGAPPADGAAEEKPEDKSSKDELEKKAATGEKKDIKTVKLRKGAPPPPTPTPQQLKALAELQAEAKEYEAGAKDYRKTLTMIVRHHYEEKRRRILSALDKEIAIEKKGLVDARDEAIRRLEQFIARYSGSNAHPVATPDAMFRLAALYEERARENFDADLSVTLKPALALYMQIIREFPNYEEIAGVYYYLGHGFTDAGLIDEGQQAFRTLVCHDKYSVKVDPADPDKVVVQPLEQDHDQKFWTEWYNRNPLPLDQDPRRKAALLTAPPGEELLFRDPYPESCKPIPQNLEPGEEPKYVAEAWWKIGDYHFDQIDPGGGPFTLNRAMSAYQHSMQWKKPPLYGVAMYKRSWTYFKQQRYKTAVEWFVNLLRYADEQEKKTGDPGADFRSEAYTYIAGSLTYVDFDGPPDGHPYIPRNDVLDVESDPLVAEEKMKIAIERVQDPQLIPQDEKWTVEIYKALAQEFIEITQNRNAIELLEVTLQKFPMDRDAPVMQNRVAELYDQLSKLAPEGSAAKEEYGARALEARTKLAAYVGATKWTDANRDDPEALQQAEDLVRGGLKRAAADHTNRARSFVAKAEQISDPEEASRWVEKAIGEYRLAETGWAAYYEQDPNALDAYESKYWLADARYFVVVLQLALGRDPKPADIQAAREANIAVRDSNEDDKFQQPAAYNVVTVAERLLEREFKKYEESNGAMGLEKRSEVKFTGEGDNRKVIKEPVPSQILDAIQAREDYVARIPADRDPERNTLLYAFQAADYYFVYGHFPEARERFQPIFEEHCGKNKYGYQAWEKLLSMANFEVRQDEIRKLVNKDCSFDEDTKAAGDALRNPTIMGIKYLDARKVYEEAEKMPDGPERDKKWREAAAMYKVALEKAPDRDEAPEAAMNGAFAYKQVGEYDKAIEMYELFISKYGSDKILKKLQQEDPKKYEQRVGFLKDAYNALANSYVLFFDYPKAAQTFDTISSIEHFEPNDRRAAAKQSLFLYSSLGDRRKMEAMRNRYKTLGASPKEIAEADFTIASTDVKKWDEFSPNEGANAAARRVAEASMTNYYNKNKRNDAAAKKVVEAAYLVAKMKRAAGSRELNKWWGNTITAFEKYKRVAPKKDGKSEALGSPEAGMAAEGEFDMLDKEIRRKFDYDAGHHRFKGTPDKVIQQYKKAAVEAEKWHKKLQKVIDAYVSPEWSTAAVARQGSVYDSLRTGLYNTREPDLVMFSAKEKKLLKKLEDSGDMDLLEKADAFRVNKETAWRTKRDQEIDAADQIMVGRYATAVVMSRRYGVANPAVTHAIRRLAFMTEVVGEAKMKSYTAPVKDLNYTEGMFQRIRPGQYDSPEADGMPAPLPVFVQ